MTIKLYDLAGADPDLRFSPFCWRTKMALRHKELVFSTLAWRFTDTAALAPSGQGRVPVIVDHGQWVSDSWRIALHLDRAYAGHPPLMRSEGERAHARLAMGWVDTLHGAIARIAVLEIAHLVAPQDRAYFRASREARFGMTLEAVTADRPGAVAALGIALHPAEQTLTDAAFLSGPTPGYADYALFGTLMWPHVVCREPVLAAGSHVAAWFERMLDLFDGFARAAPTVRD